MSGKATAAKDPDGFTPEQRAHWDRVFAEFWEEQKTCARCGRHESKVTLAPIIMAKACAGRDAAACDRLVMRSRFQVLEGGRQ